MSLENTGAPSAVYSVADRAWKEMQEHGVLPTPRNFELWFTYLENTHSAVSRKLAAILQSGHSPTAQQLRSLHVQTIGNEIDLDTITEQSEQLDEAAQRLVDDVSANKNSLHTYGAVLLALGKQAEEDQTLTGLLRVVSALATETSRAGERTRLLEQQLASSGSRISKLRTELSDARQNANTDGLTGLRNRRAFDTGLRRAMKNARAEAAPMCLLLFDIDNFKRFNDEYGHNTGDLVLRLVAGIIADNVKGRDIAARYGGEEFAVILTAADLGAGLTVARQIRAVLDGKHLLTKSASRPPAMVTLSAGVAQLRPTDSPPPFIERADAALYAAKHQGRNCVCAETPASGDGVR